MRMDDKSDGEEAELYIGGPVEADGHLGIEGQVPEEALERRDILLEASGRDLSISVGHAAQIFSVCPKTIRRWCDDGRLDYFRTPGGHRRVRWNAEQFRQIRGHKETEASRLDDKS